MKRRIITLFESFQGAVSLDQAAMGGYLNLRPEEKRALQFALHDLVDKERRLERSADYPPRYSLVGRAPKRPNGAPRPRARKEDRRGGFVEVQQNTLESEPEDRRFAAPAHCLKCKRRWSPIYNERYPALVRLKQFEEHGEVCPGLPEDPTFVVEGLDWLFFGSRTSKTRAMEAYSANLKLNIPVKPGEPVEHARMVVRRPGAKGPTKASGTLALHFAGDNPYTKGVGVGPRRPRKA